MYSYDAYCYCCSSSDESVLLAGTDDPDGTTSLLLTSQRKFNTTNSQRPVSRRLRCCWNACLVAARFIPEFLTPATPLRPRGSSQRPHTQAAAQPAEHQCRCCQHQYDVSSGGNRTHALSRSVQNATEGSGEQEVCCAPAGACPQTDCGGRSPPARTPTESSTPTPCYPWTRPSAASPRRQSLELPGPLPWGCFPRPLQVTRRPGRERSAHMYKSRELTREAVARD